MGSEMCIRDSFASRGDRALFHFHEIADFAIVADVGVRAEMGIGADRHLVTDACLLNHRVQHGDSITDLSILNQAARPKPAVVADTADTPQMRLGLDHHIATEAAAFAQRAAARIHESDAFIHPVVTKPLLKECLALGQLASIVDAVHFISIGHFHVHGSFEHGHGVGQIELSLVVVCLLYTSDAADE